MCSEDIWDFLEAPSFVYQDNFNTVQRNITPEEFKKYNHRFRELTKIYCDIPPIWNGPPRISTVETFLSISDKAVFDQTDIKQMGLSEDTMRGKSMDKEALNYQFPNYVELK